MPNCEDNITEVMPHMGVRHQWVVGPTAGDDLRFYTGDYARTECVNEALRNITTDNMMVAFYGVNEQEQYEEEWHWESAIIPTDLVMEILDQVRYDEENGMYTPNTALLALAESFIPDAGWLDVSSIAFSDHEPPEDDEF